MAKRSKAPTNLGQGIPRVGGELVDRLNKLDEGLGTALAYELNHRFSIADSRTRAAAGHAGTVVLAEQQRDSAGNRPASMDVSGGNIAGSAWATQSDELPPLGQVRSLFTCDKFGGHPSGFPGWFEECVEQEQPVAIPSGIVHAMWGVTYEIPSNADLSADDPGESEFGLGNYYQYIIPSTTIVDQVTWWKSGVAPVDGNIAFGLYSLDVAEASFPVVCKTAATDLTGLGAGAHTIPLTESAIIAPGLYALAYIAPCFNVLSIRLSAIAETMVNSLWSQRRYGQFDTDGSDEMPDVIDSSNIHIGLPIVAPAAYFSDSAQFG